MCELHGMWMIVDKCLVCGCTESTPCTLEGDVPCAWFDARHTLCDNPHCIATIDLPDLEEMFMGRA